MPKCMSREEVIEKFTDPDALRKVMKIWDNPDSKEYIKEYRKSPSKPLKA